MFVKLLTEHHLDFLSLKGSSTGSSESTHVKMPHCWKSHTLAQIIRATVLELDRLLIDDEKITLLTFEGIPITIFRLRTLVLKQQPDHCIII